MQSFFSNLNLRLMVIHFFAFWLFIFAFYTLGFLHDYQFLYFISQHINRINFPERFYGDMVFVEQAGNIGLLAAYVISWTISSKRDWFWLNSVIIFILCFVLKNFGLPRLKYYNSVVMSPGGIFKVYTFWSHIALGAIAIAIGLFIFFFKAIIVYIDGNKQPAEKLAKA